MIKIRKEAVVVGIVLGVCGISAVVWKIVKGKKEAEVAEVRTDILTGDEREHEFMVIPKDETVLEPEMFGQDDYILDEDEKIVPDANGGISVAEAFHKYMPESVEQDLYSVITEEEYLDLDAAHCHCCTYFAQDDILAGVDEYLNEIGPEFDLYLVGVNALKESGDDTVFLMNNESGEAYEIVSSDENYLEAYADINGGCLPIEEDGDEDGEDQNN